MAETHIQKQSDLSKVDGRTGNLVYGFCRDIYDTFPSDNVYYSLQDVIINICIAFYWIRYEWREKPQDQGDLVSFENKKIATKLTQSDCCIFVDTTISSGVWEYKFRIHCIGQRDQGFDDVIIGIVPISGVEKAERYAFIYVEEDAYGFGGTASSKSGPHTWGNANSYGKVLDDGDEVRMIINLDDGNLLYYINDEDYGICHDDIKQNMTYRACVYLFGSGTKIELLQ